MLVRAVGAGDFAELGRKFRAAGKNGALIRRETTKAIQAELDVIVREQKHEALSMHIKGTGGRGAARREAFHGAHRKRSRRGGHGLRSYTAAGIKSKVSYTGYKLGARITVDPSALPQSQRKLPLDLNKPRGWRHPTWGHRDRWVAQVGEPFFDRPIARHRDGVRVRVARVVNEALHKELKA